MKRIALIIALTLLPLCSLKAQSFYLPYKTYSLEARENKIGEIFRCEEAMSIDIGYTNQNWKNRGSMPEANPPMVPGTANAFSMHGLHYNSEYLLPIWGPIGLGINWLGFSAGFGKITLPASLKEDGTLEVQEESNYNINLNLGLLPVVQMHFGPKFHLNLMGGVKGYWSIVDGSSSYKIVSTSEKKNPSIASGLFANWTVGLDIVFDTVGIRVSYEKCFTNRLKDKYLENIHLTRAEYNPGYEMLNVGLVIWMDL